MDITTVFGLIGNKETEKQTPTEPTNPSEELGSNNFTVKTDALSAVKLDPAVLEAQVTIDMAPNVASYVSDDNLHEDTFEKEVPSMNPTFEELLASMHQNAQLNITSQQCALLMIYANNLRNQRFVYKKQNECAFCKNNGQSAMWYTGHSLRDGRGRVRCPMLRAIKCPRCGGTGDRAHTPKYCPNNKYRS